MKVILALAATWKLPAKHGDIPNAYVKADEEAHLDIYLQTPQGMDVEYKTLKSLGAKRNNDLVLQLRKSLYGLEQVGRLWSQLLHTRLTEAGFEQRVADMCLCHKQDGEDVGVVGVYVDDLLATGTSAVAVNNRFASLGLLSIKDLGRVSKFLGMRVALDDDGSSVLDQEEAIKDLLREHGLYEANSTLAPIGADCYEVQDEDSALLEETSTFTSPSIKNLQSLVGSLLWVARCTRPDVTFAVHKAMRQTHQPRVHDWKLAKRIARYLKGTQRLKMKMETRVEDRDLPTLKSYSDADFASGKQDRKSLTESVILLNGMSLSWSAKKQGGVSLSTMEAEFVDAAEASRELIGVREMLDEVGMAPALPMLIHVDNQAAIKQLEGEAPSIKAKHVDVRLKFV